MRVFSRFSVPFAAIVLGLPILLGPSAVAAQTRPTPVQAAAAVAVYKATREQCAAEGPACEEKAKRQFVEAMNCVVHGRRALDPATVEREFTSYVDLVSELLGGQQSLPSGDAGHCFAAAAPARPQSPRGSAREPPTESEGPSAETLRRFRKQAEEQSRPVTPAPPEGPSAHDKLKADIEALRGRVRPQAAPTPAPPAPSVPSPGQ
jgi:hypothetical protein